MTRAKKPISPPISVLGLDTPLDLVCNSLGISSYRGTRMDTLTWQSYHQSHWPYPESLGSPGRKGLGEVAWHLAGQDHG